MGGSVIQIQSRNGDRIYICQIQERDAWSICDFVVSNETRLTSFFPKTREQNLTPDLSKRFTQLKRKEFDSKIEYLFTLKEEQSKKVIGLIYIKELDKIDGQGEFAYCIDYTYEGQGIITKSVFKLVSYAFENLDLNRLQIVVHKTNLGSIKVAKNCDFSWQQTLIEEYNPTGNNALDMELYERYKK